MVPLKDIGRMANCSVSTVSLVLNARKGISDATRRRVLDAAQKAGYRHDEATRRLAQRRRLRGGRRALETIGFVLVDQSFDSGQHGEYLHHVMEQAEQRGMRVLTGVWQRGGQCPLFVQTREVDGVIVTGHVDDGILRRLQELELAVVVLGDYEVTLPVNAVTADCVTLGRQAVETLARLGHRRIGFIAETLEIASNRHILQGYRDTVARLGLDDEPALVQVSGRIGEAGRMSATNLLRLPSPPTAILATDKRTATHVVTVLDCHGRRVPEDMSVLSVGEHLGTPCIPQLSVLAVPVENQMEQAIESLVRVYNHPQGTPMRVLVGSRYQAGASIGAPAPVGAIVPQRSETRVTQQS